VAYVTIGEFSRRSRLSAKALRLYDELGLVTPERVDPDTGYRLYSESQVERARLVGLLRRLGMPLAVIGRTLSLDGPQASQVLARWWAAEVAAAAERSALVRYAQTWLEGGVPGMYDVQVRTLPARTVVSVRRHVDRGAVDGFVVEAFARLSATGPWLEGIAGAPYLVFYGEVSEDSDGPVEVCRPVAAACDAMDTVGPEVQCRLEAVHDEAYVRLALRDLGWPAVLPVIDALDRWVRENGREPAGDLREVFIADPRTAAPETLVCDLTMPLR